MAAALVVGTAGCGVSTDEGFQPVADGDVPFGLADPTTTTSSTTTTVPPSTSTTQPLPSTTTLAQLVEIYLVSGDTVVSVNRAVPPPVGLPQVVRLLEAGPVPGDPTGVRNLVTAGLVAGVDLRGGVAYVDLSPAFAEEQLPSAVQQLIIAQLVYTLAAQQGVGQVAFTLAGGPIAVPLADGSVATGPISRDAYRAIPTTVAPAADPNAAAADPAATSTSTPPGAATSVTPSATPPPASGG